MKQLHLPGISMRGELRYWKGIVVLVFSRADTLTVRLIVANASFLWAIGAIMVPDTFDRHGYEVIRHVPRWVWVSLFMLHFAGVYWRIFDPKQRVHWGMFINGLGLGVWLLTTMLINMAIGEFAIGTSVEWILCGASAWAMYRTGLKTELKLLTD